jgi:membrane protease YdiL (CAAX protease family)
MAAPASSSRVAGQPEWLLLGATAALVAFHYLTRADAVGVFAEGRGWFPLTGAPWSPGLHFALSGLILGLLPVLLARVGFGISLAELGLGFGRWRAGLVWLAVGLPLAVLAGKTGAGSEAVRAVYPLGGTLSAEPAGFAPHAMQQFLYFGAWEVLFRGVLLFGLRRRIGPLAANLLQTALSVTAHFGRPLDETFAAIPAGLVFGWVDLQVGSIWYVAVLHWVVGVSLDYFISTSG